MKNPVLALIAVSLLAGSLFAETLSCSFPYTYFTSTDRFISTDISASPSIAQPSTVICVGDAYAPSMAISSSWYASQYSTALKSEATSAGCLVSSTAVNKNNGIFWVSGTSMSSIATDEGIPFGSVADFNSFASGNGLPTGLTSEASKYGDNAGSGTFPNSGAAAAGVYCSGSLRLYSVSSTIPGYSYDQTIAGDYLGAIPSGYSKPQPSSAGTVNFKLDLTTSNCVAAARTYMNSAACPASSESVWVYARCSSAAPHTFSSTSVPVTFEPKFSCNLSTGGASVSPSPATSGQQVTFTFTLRNDDVRDINVTSLALEAGSQFSNLHLASPATPFTVAKGASVAVSGTATAPTVSASATVPLRLILNGDSTASDCEGTIKHCTNKLVLSVQITVTPGNKPDYTVELPAPFTGTVGQSFTIPVTTRNIGGAAGGAASNTNVTFSGATRTFTVPDLPATTGSNTQTATFTCASAGVFTISADADSTYAIAESNEGNNHGSTTITCNPPPQLLCTIAFPSHASSFKPGESGIAQASCTQGGSAVSCPALSWSQNAQGASLNPTSTPAGANPQTTLAISSSAPTPQTGRSVGASNSALGIACTPLPFDIVQDTTPTSCSLALSESSLLPGSSATATATCYNSLSQDVNCPAFSWSQNAQGGSLSPAGTSAAANPQATLSIGASATAPQSGRSVTATASAFSCSSQFSVDAPPQTMHLNCAFESGHSSIFFQGESAPALATCDIGGTPTACPTLLWSTQSLSGATLSPASTASAPHRSTLSISASAPVPQSGSVLVQCQDAGKCDNTCSMPVSIYSRPTQLNCTLLNSHGSLFAPGDSETVQGMCMDAGSQNTFCPPLTWQTSISSYSFTPNPTPASLNPTTLFLVYPEAAYPQSGYINAANADFGLTCISPIRIDINLHGPDYVVSQISFDPSVALVGQSVKVYVTVRNVGNENATNSTATQLTGSGCTPLTLPLQHLDSGASYEQGIFTCPCTAIGWQGVTAEANVNRNQYETTYANNKRDSAYFCKTVVQMTCSDFV